MKHLYFKSLIASAMLLCCTIVSANLSVIAPNGVMDIKQEAAARAADAENYLAIAPITLAPGEEVEVPVLLYNTIKFNAWQILLDLPECVEIPYDEDEEEYAISIGSYKNDHILSANLPSDGIYRIAAMSLTNKNLKGNSGDAVAVMTIKAADDATPGEYEAVVSSIKLGAKDAANNQLPADFTVKITITDTTGINGIASEGAANNEAICDLTGRKVTEMVKGGIYIKGGKKIFVK